MTVEELEEIMNRAGDNLLDEFTNSRWRNLSEDELDLVADVICDLKFAIKREFKKR